MNGNIFGSIVSIIISQIIYFINGYNPVVIFFLCMSLFFGYWSVEKKMVNYHINK